MIVLSIKVLLCMQSGSIDEAPSAKTGSRIPYDEVLHVSLTHKGDSKQVLRANANHFYFLGRSLCAFRAHILMRLICTRHIFD